MNAKQALSLAGKLQERFAYVVIDGRYWSIRQVIHAKGHCTRIQHRECDLLHDVHQGPIIRTTNVTAYVNADGFYHPKKDEPPRRFDLIEWCKKCNSVLKFEVAKV